MKKNLIIAYLLFITNNCILNAAQTPGKLNVTVTTIAPGGGYSPKNVVAIWIETNAGVFVKSLLVYANARKNDLTTWYPNSAGNVTDAVTGATQSSNATRTCTWNGTDIGGIKVADGTYRVCMNIADGKTAFGSFTITKGTSAVTLTPVNVTGFSNINISWAPDPLIISTSTTSLSGFNYSGESGPSHEQSFMINGSLLTNNLVITAPDSYEISLNSGSTFVGSNVITLPLVSGNVENTPIYVRLKAGLNTGNYSENIIISSLNAINTSVSCTGTVVSLSANAGSDKTIVCGGSVQLDYVTSNYTGTGTIKYKWIPSTGLNNDAIANPTATISSSIAYAVTVTTPNGSYAVDSVNVTVNALTVNAGIDNNFVCGTTIQLAATTNYSGTGKLKYKWTPSEGLNIDTISNPVVSSFLKTNYEVTVTTPNGCIATDNVTVQPKVADKQQIKLVGVDSNNKNIVVWNNINSLYIDSVYVYKETNVTDKYSKIGAASYLSLVFTDSLSHPMQSSNLYKISLLDKCGLETALSETHKTMHLSINQGQGNTWNLIWEGYSGFTVSTYNIYRGTTTNNLTLLAQVSGNIYQFSDFYPPVGSVFYQIEVIAPGSQSNAPFSENDILKVNSTMIYTSSRSNIVTNNLTGLNNLYIDNNFFTVYPNPAKDEVVIAKENGVQSSLKIYNMVGGVVKTILTTGISTKINVSDMPDNMYIIEVKTGNKVGRQKLIVNR